MLRFWQNPGYWPVTFRITPIWHRVSTGKVLVDTYSSGIATPTGQAVQRVTSSGFDLSGLDFHTVARSKKHLLLRAAIFGSNRFFPL